MTTVDDVRITILVDNLANEGLETEHGFSLWIEADDRRILFDTGQGGALEKNAAALGVELARADMLVLSHGHYDHTGAIPYVLREAQELDIYCHPDILQTRYAIREGKPKSIGIPDAARKAFLDQPPDRVHAVQGTVMLTENIGLVAPVPRETSYEDTGGPFYLDPEGRQPDLIEDDLSLWVDTDAGVIVCLGCAHAGPINILRHIRSLTEGSHIRGVIGGFHLMHAKRERVDKTIVALRELQPDLVVPCHCTGKDAFGLLEEAMGGRVQVGAAGMVLRF